MSTTAPDPLEQLTRALDATGDLLAGVREDQWGAPTGCPGWRVRELVDHLVGGNRTFAAILSGQAPPDRDADHLRDDPIGAYRDAGQALRAGFSRPGVLEEEFSVPAGRLPGAAALHLRITELLVHGWDLARATGQATTGLPAELAETELAFSARQIDALPPDRRPFAPPQPVPGNAPAIDRLVAYLGRPVVSPTGPPAPAAATDQLTGLGARVHLFVRPAARQRFTALFRDVLGCQVAELEFGLDHPVLLVWFPDASRFSVEFSDLAPLEPDHVDDATALRGAWIEFRTTDVEAFQRRLEEAGVPQFGHPGSPHRYFSAPGGQVFRLIHTSYTGP